jgi:acyl phosphate:glycerol-3-phosphate acyltransferase
VQTTLAALLGYLFGSVPFAFLLCRRRGIDLRAVGSGNVGAANVLRTSGLAAAITAMCLDSAKGSAAVLLAQAFAPGPGGAVAAGLGSIVGHVYPLWLRFKGGKGVATAAGVFVVLAPAALGISAASFLLTVMLSRYVSLGSLVASVTLAGGTWALTTPTAVKVAAMAAAALILFRHRGNLARIGAGTERRLGVRR